MRPVRPYADLGVIETSRGQGIENERAPESNQDRQEHRDLNSQRRKREQEQEGVAQADLRERVLECPVGLRPPERAQEDAEQDQRYAAPHGVPEQLPESRAACAPVRQREWQR